MSFLAPNRLEIQLNYNSSGLVTRFPLFSAVISSVIFLVISLLVLAAFFLPALQRTHSHSAAHPQPQMPQTPRQWQKQRAGLSDDSEDYDDDDEEKPWRSRRKSISSSRNPLASVSSILIPDKICILIHRLEQDADVKVEAPATIVLEAPAGSSRTGTPLRRRRSRLSQNMAEEDS